MTVQLFLILLFAFSTIASLLTEALKKLFSSNGNITAFIVSIIVGILGTFIYCVLTYTIINFYWIIYAILFGVASSLVSQLGYDKIKEAIIAITQN